MKMQNEAFSWPKGFNIKYHIFLFVYNSKQLLLQLYILFTQFKHNNFYWKFYRYFSLDVWTELAYIVSNVHPPVQYGYYIILAPFKPLYKLYLYILVKFQVICLNGVHCTIIYHCCMLSRVAWIDYQWTIDIQFV